ncbi:MAG: SMI1/KNR4 family protein [Candidatus Dormibacteraceae bacterium]
MANDNSLIERLRARTPDEWWSRAPASPDEVEDLERELGVRLPEDYRQLLLASNGGSINGPRASINLESAQGVLDMNLDGGYQDELPEMIVIGDDGGGDLYFYDPTNKLGRGAYAIYLVGMADLDPAAAAFVAPSLSEAIDRVYAGESFRRPPGSP